MFSAYGRLCCASFSWVFPWNWKKHPTWMLNSLQTYFHVILPLSKSALATLGTLRLSGNWQSFLYPLVMVNRDGLKNAPLDC